jgi:hypothetical protein
MEHAHLTRRATIAGWAVGLLVSSAALPGPAKACLVRLDVSVAAVASELAVRSIRPDTACLELRVAFARLDPNRATRAPARANQASQQTPTRYDAMGREEADIGFEAGALKAIRDYLGPEATQALRDFYKSIRSGGDAAAPAPGAADADLDAADREQARRIYDDVAAIERRSQPQETSDRYDSISSGGDGSTTDSQTEISIDGDVADAGLGSLPLDAKSLFNPIHPDGEVVASGPGAANRYIDVGVEGDIEFRSEAIQAANFFGGLQLDSAGAAAGLGAINRYNPADNGLQLIPIASSGSGHAGGWSTREITSPFDLLAVMLQFLFSSEGVAYSVIVAFAYLVFVGLRKLMGTSRRAKPASLAGASPASERGTLKSPGKTGATRPRRRRTTKRLRLQE